MTSHFGPARHWSISVLLTGALAAALILTIPAFTPEAQAACNTTSEGQVLVMSDNVYEAEKNDASKSGDMRNFVDRMKQMAPSRYAPDIVLVQEVRKRAVNNIKRFMENKFDCNFSIPVNASKKGWDWIRKYWKLGGQDAAVIVNTDSMLSRDKGFITHNYARSDAANGESVKVKKTAWVKVLEKNQPNENETPLTVLAASVHFPRGSEFKNEQTNKHLKKKFSEDVAQKLEKKQSDGSDQDEVIHVIGGDFNMARFNRSPNNPLPPYKVLTSRPWNYVDGPISLTTGGNPNPIDFLFSTGKPLKAKMDTRNNSNENSRGFYSNHDLRWSLLAPYPR